MARRYEHAVAVTVTVVTLIVTDSEDSRSVPKKQVLARAADLMRSWKAEDVEAHLEDSGLEYIEALPISGGPE